MGVLPIEKPHNRFTDVNHVCLTLALDNMDVLVTFGHYPLALRQLRYR